MALYTQDNGWERFARQKAEQQRQQAMQNLQQKQAGLDAAQNQPKKSTLEEALGGLVTGIGERLSDIGNTAKNVGKTAFGWFNELISGGQTDNTMKDDSKRRNDIAKKYGFNSYTEAINSNKVGDDFWNEIKGSNAQTKKTLDTQINDYRNSASGKLADVTKINTKEAMGQALNTYDTLLGALPLGGAYNALANAGGGVLSGVGDELKAAGREGRDFNWNQAKNNAIVGAGSGLAGAAGSALAGKAAAKAGGNALGKLLGSNVARGAAGGAAAGATGGALGAALNGGTLEDALLAAKEGAKAGGIGGGAMAGAMGLGGKALDRFRNGKNGRATTIDTSEPVEAQIVQKNRIEAPNQRQLASTVEAVEPISTRRGIAITDLDAGEQPVNVRNANQKYSKKFIDGVVAPGTGLPEAELPKPLTVEQRYQKGMGDANILDSVSRGQFSDEFGYQNLMDNLPKELQERVKAATADGALENNPYAGFNTKYEVRSQADLPTLDRQQYYNDVTGNLKRNGGVLSSADIPEYMQSHLRDGGGRNNDVLLNELFGDDMDLRDQYEQYQQMAQVRQPKTYTTENMAYGLNMDSNLANDITEYLANEYGPKPTEINIEKALAQTQDVPVENLATNYRKSTIPARQYNEQAIQNMPEAEIATRTAGQVAPEPETTAVATGWGGKNMENASKKRNFLQKAGDTLQETGQATKDSQVYSKLKGNTAEEMARKNSVERLRELGFNSTDYDKAANLSEVVNKYYDDAVKQTKTPIEAPQLRNIAREVADDLHISSANRADLEKLVGTMLDDAVKHDGKLSAYSMDRYTPADLEKVAKQLGQKAENITTTNYGGRKKAIRNLTPDNEEYARALGEVRNRIRNEIGEMADYNEAELVARMKNAGATQKQIDYVTQNHTLRGAKAQTSLFEDARTMNQQIKSDAFKRGANATNSTNIVTQVANASGASGLVNTIARPVANAIGSAEKGVGKVLSAAGNKLAGVSNGEAGATAGKIASTAKNIAGKAGEKIAGATSSLNNDTLANLALGGFDTLGNQAGKFANKQLGSTTANAAQDRLESARTLANAQADYDNALADYQASEAQTNALTQQMQQSQSQLGRIEQAMQLALNAGDITAYSQLADLYKQAAEIESLTNPTEKANADLSSSQKTKLNEIDTSMNTLNQLKNAYEQAGGGKGLVGNLSEFANSITGGAANRNLATYNDLKNSLGMAIVKNIVSVGGTEQDAKRYVAMLPSASDTPEQAAQKFAYLEDMLNSAKQSVYNY